MSHARFTKWVCDRCGYSPETKDHDQPTGWISLHIADPVLAVPDDKGDDLCRDCANELYAWRSRS